MAPDGKIASFARKDVARIYLRVKQPRTHYLHHIAESAILPLLGTLTCDDGAGCSSVAIVAILVIFSPVWAYTAASAPFFLAAEGIGALVPHGKTIEILP